MDSLTSNTIILSHHGLARTTTLHVYTIMGLYHHGGFSLKNFFSSRWSLPVRCVWRSYVYMCMCVYVLTVCFILFSESYTTSIPQGEECDVVDTWVMVIVNKGMALFGSFCCNVKLTSSSVLWCCLYFNMPVNVGPWLLLHLCTTTVMLTLDGSWWTSS